MGFPKQDNIEWQVYKGHLIEFFESTIFQSGLDSD